MSSLLIQALCFTPEGGQAHLNPKPTSDLTACRDTMGIPTVLYTVSYGGDYHMKIPKVIHSIVVIGADPLGP